MDTYEHSQKPTGPRVSPELRTALFRQLQDMMLDTDPDYPAFLEAAKAEFPELANKERFRFITRRLWRQWGGEPPTSWLAKFRERYRKFEEVFDWTVKASPSWVSQSLIDRTLSVFQRRYPMQLSARMALEMIVRVSRLHDAEVLG